MGKSSLPQVKPPLELHVAETFKCAGVRDRGRCCKHLAVCRSRPVLVLQQALCLRRSKTEFLFHQARLTPFLTHVLSCRLLAALAAKVSDEHDLSASAKFSSRVNGSDFARRRKWSGLSAVARFCRRAAESRTVRGGPLQGRRTKVAAAEKIFTFGRRSLHSSTRGLPFTLQVAQTGQQLNSNPSETLMFQAQRSLDE